MATALKKVVRGPIARVSPFKGGEIPCGNSGNNNEPHFSIPRKPVMRTAVPETYLEDFEMHKLDRKPVKDTSHQSSPFEASSLGTLRVWWLGILCCSLVVGALLAIVATVYPYQDRPLLQWPYNLSINSLVSIHVVVLKAAMLLVLAEGLEQLKWSWFRQPHPLANLSTYNDASRGPFRAVSLLWTLRGRSITSSIGALVTISALTIFVAMVAEMARASDAQGLHDYKSRVLPLVYHRLEHMTQDQRGKEIDRTAEMNRDAKQLYVRLSATDRG